MPQPDRGSQRHTGSPPAELVLGALGGVLVLAALVFLLVHAVAVRDRGPLLRAQVVGVSSGPPGSGEQVVRFEVANDGGVTAEGVRIVGELTRDGRVVETVSATVAYVPVESRRVGALVFREDPASGSLTVRAVSYTLP